jgi:transcriptional regulator with XRE-family HTH domain
MWDTSHMASSFGSEIRVIRQAAGETLAQTAAAIRIDRSHLTKIELGQDRPSERIVQALLTHFAVSRAVTARLWALSGMSSELVAAEDYRNYNHK